MIWNEAFENIDQWKYLDTFQMRGLQSKTKAIMMIFVFDDGILYTGDHINITSIYAVTRTTWRPTSPATLLFVQQMVQDNSKNIKAPYYCPFVKGIHIGGRWIFLTKVQ